MCLFMYVYKKTKFKNCVAKQLIIYVYVVQNNVFSSKVLQALICQRFLMPKFCAIRMYGIHMYLPQMHNDPHFPVFGSHYPYQCMI